jgi:ParB family chromosome partitioning protein
METKNSKPRTSTMVISMDKLEVCPHNPRKRDLDLDELAESIKEGEVKEVVEVHPFGDTWHVIAGQRRFLAAKKAGKTELECLEYPFDEAAAEDWCMKDAFHKKEYNPLDIADLSVRAIEKYGSIQKASQATGISESKFKKYNPLRNLAQEIREQIGSLGTAIPSIETLGKISSLPATKQLEVFEAVKGKTRLEAGKILNRIQDTSPEEPIANKEKKHLILIELSDSTYVNLKAKAGKTKLSLEKLCVQVLDNHASQQEPEGGS